MKMLLLAAALVIVSAAAQACTLSGSDLKGLALSPSHLTAKDFAAMDAAHQRSVCLTRAYLHMVDAHRGVIDTVDPYNRKYLSPAEAHRVAEAGDDFVMRSMKKEKGN